MMYISLWNSLLPAFGAGATVYSLLSYFGESPLFYSALAFLLVLGIGFLLPKIMPKGTWSLLTAGFFVLLAFPLLFHESFTRSELTAAIPLITHLKEPYDVEIALPTLSTPGSPTPFLLFLTLWVAWFFLSSQFGRIFKLLSGLLSLAILLVGFYFGVDLPVFAVLLSAAYLVTLFPTFSNHGPGHPEILSFLTALVLGLLLCLAVPENRYEQPRLFSSLQEKIVSFIDPYDPIFHAGNGYSGLMKGTEGRFPLGNQDGIRYTGRVIASIESADVSHRLYLRNWVGGLYENNRWNDLPDRDYQPSASLFSQNQGEWYDQGAWLMEVLSRNPALAEKLLNYTQENELEAFKKDFMVSHVYEKSHFFLLPYDADFGASFFIYDRSPMSQEEKAYRTDIWQLPGGPLLSMMARETVTDPYYLTYLEGEKRYRDFVYSHYLTIPETVKEALQSLGPITPVQTLSEKQQRIEEIKDFLQAHYTYSTHPGKTPKDKDFISYFLTESKKGYCTSFASAAVMLLRASGIPARYVVGLSVDAAEINEARLSPEGLHALDINDHHAHAWAEVYVDGLGWRPCEMTPAVEGNENPFPIPPEKQKNNSQAPETPPDPKDRQKQPQENPSPSQEQPKENSQSPRKQAPQPQLRPQTPLPTVAATSSLLALIGKLLLLLLLICLYPLYRLWSIHHLFRRALQDETGFHHLLTYSQKLTTWAGHPLQGSYEEWKQSLAKDPRFAGYPSLIDTLIEAKYSGTPLSLEEKETICITIRESRQKCLEGLALKKKLDFWLIKKM